MVPLRWSVFWIQIFDSIYPLWLNWLLRSIFDDESPKLTLNYLISYSVTHISGCYIENWIMQYGRRVRHWMGQDILFSFILSHMWFSYIFCICNCFNSAVFSHSTFKREKKTLFKLDSIKHTMQTMERLRSHETGIFKKPSDLMQIFKVRRVLLIFSNMNRFLLLDWNMLNGAVLVLNFTNFLSEII